MKYLVICALLLHTAVYAQNFKFGNVSKSELAEKVNQLHPESDATILYRNYSIDFEYRDNKGLVQIIEVHERVKIYNPNGYEWATKSVRTYQDGKDRELFKVKGNTYTLVNGSINKQRLEKDAIFEKSISNYWMENSFTMPNIQVGSIVEYVYTIISPFAEIEPIDLQYTIPIRQQEIQLKVPEYYTYNRYNNPQAKLAFQFTEKTEQKTLNIYGRKSIGSVFDQESSNAFDRMSSRSTKNSVSYIQTTYSLNEKNIPPITKERFVTNLDNYKAKSLWELAVVKTPQGFTESIATTWEDVAKSIYKNISFSGELKNYKYFADDLEAVIKDIEDDVIKMEAILTLLKGKVSWNNYVSFIPEEGLKKAYEKGSGNVADINLLLVSMLQKANFNAAPVLLSTVSNGIPVYPTRKGFNYVIANVTIGNTHYLLDASDPYSGLNILPARAMNWQGRMIREDGSSNWIDLYPSYTSHDLIFAEAEIVNENVVLEVKERKGKQFAREFREKYAFTNDQTQINELVSGDNQIGVSNFEIADLNTSNENLNIAYTAKVNEVVEKVSDDLYVSPLLYFAHKENPFKSDVREHPVFFKYPSAKKHTITLKIPEGYVTKSLPQGTKISLENDLGSYTYLIRESNGKIQVMSSLELNTPYILAKDYKYLKEIYSQIVKKEKEKVIFTKI